MGACISHVSSLCKGKVPSVADPAIHAEKDNGVSGVRDVETQRQFEEEQLRKLRQEAKVLEKKRLKKEQEIAKARAQKEQVQKQLAEHEEKRKRFAFDQRKRKERHAQLARRDSVRQYVLNEILDASVNNIMNDKERYGEIYKDWRRRNGVMTVQRLHHHYHRDGSVSIKVFESCKKRRHHKKKPHDYGYVPPPDLAPVNIDRERIESYHSLNINSFLNFSGKKINGNRHFHNTLKCWHGSSLDDYSSDEERDDEVSARNSISSAHEYVFMDETQASVSSRPISRLVAEFGSREGDYVPSGSISYNGFFDDDGSMETATVGGMNPSYHSKFIFGLSSYEDNPENTSYNNMEDCSWSNNEGDGDNVINSTLEMGDREENGDDISITAEDLAVQYSVLLVERAIQLAVMKIREFI